MADQALRVGAIGTGNVFTRAHLPAYTTLDGLRLTAVYDTNPVMADAARGSYLDLCAPSPGDKGGRGGKRGTEAGSGRGAPTDLKVCASAEELMEDVDVVDICTPARWHPYYAAMALNHGVHAMTEKPMARTWWEAQRMAEVAAESSALFQLTDDNVFLPRYRVLRNIIDSGMIGEVQSVWIARGSHGPEENAWFWDMQEGGGGCIMDYGTHAVTSVWFLLGYDKVPAEVRSLGLVTRQPARLVGGRFREVRIDDDAHFKVRFANPKNGDWATAVIEATWSWPELGPTGDSLHGYIHVRGSTGTATGLTDEGGSDVIRVSPYTGGERYIPVETLEPERESFIAAIDNFARCIRAGEQSILNEQVGLGVMSVLNGAQLSELRGRTAVTPADVSEFCREIAGDAPDPWKGGDRIIAELSKPYRTS